MAAVLARPSQEEDDRRLKAELQVLRRKGALRSEDFDEGSSGEGRACARCRAELGRIINRGAYCRACRLRVCKACREYSLRTTDWVCSVCHKHMEIQAATGEWMNEYARRPSRRRDNRVYVPPADVIKRSIRRSWTISNPSPRWSSLRGSAELRAYSSLPRHQDHPRALHDRSSLGADHETLVVSHTPPRSERRDASPTGRSRRTISVDSVDSGADFSSTMCDLMNTSLSPIRKVSPYRDVKPASLGKENQQVARLRSVFGESKRMSHDSERALDGDGNGERRSMIPVALGSLERKSDSGSVVDGNLERRSLIPVALSSYERRSSLGHDSDKASGQDQRTRSADIMTVQQKRTMFSNRDSEKSSGIGSEGSFQRRSGASESNINPIAKSKYPSDGGGNKTSFETGVSQQQQIVSDSVKKNSIDCGNSQRDGSSYQRKFLTSDDINRDSEKLRPDTNNMRRQILISKEVKSDMDTHSFLRQPVTRDDVNHDTMTSHPEPSRIHRHSLMTDRGSSAFDQMRQDNVNFQPRPLISDGLNRGCQESPNFPRRSLIADGIGRNTDELRRESPYLRRRPLLSDELSPHQRRSVFNHDYHLEYSGTSDSGGELIGTPPTTPSVRKREDILGSTSGADIEALSGAVFRKVTVKRRRQDTRRLLDHGGRSRRARLTEAEDHLLPDYLLEAEGDDYKLVFISSDSSSKEEDFSHSDDADVDADSSSTSSASTPGFSLDDCDWDYFESASVVRPVLRDSPVPPRRLSQRRDANDSSFLARRSLPSSKSSSEWSVLEDQALGGSYLEAAAAAAAAAAPRNAPRRRHLPDSSCERSLEEMTCEDQRYLGECPPGGSTAAPASYSSLSQQRVSARVAYNLEHILPVPVPVPIPLPVPIPVPIPAALWPLPQDSTLADIVYSAERDPNGSIRIRIRSLRPSSGTGSPWCLWPQPPAEPQPRDADADVVTLVSCAVNVGELSAETAPVGEESRPGVEPAAGDSGFLNLAMITTDKTGSGRAPTEAPQESEEAVQAPPDPGVVLVMQRPIVEVEDINNNAVENTEVTATLEVTLAGSSETAAASLLPRERLSSGSSEDSHSSSSDAEPVHQVYRVGAASTSASDTDDDGDPFCEVFVVNRDTDDDDEEEEEEDDDAAKIASSDSEDAGDDGVDDGVVLLKHRMTSSDAVEDAGYASGDLARDRTTATGDAAVTGPADVEDAGVSAPTDSTDSLVSNESVTTQVSLGGGRECDELDVSAESESADDRAPSSGVAEVSGVVCDTVLQVLTTTRVSSEVGDATELDNIARGVENACVLASPGATDELFTIPLSSEAPTSSYDDKNFVDREGKETPQSSIACDNDTPTGARFRPQVSGKHVDESADGNETEKASASSDTADTNCPGGLQSTGTSDSSGVIPESEENASLNVCAEESVSADVTVVSPVGAEECSSTSLNVCAEEVSTKVILADDVGAEECISAKLDLCAEESVSADIVASDVKAEVCTSANRNVCAEVSTDKRSANTRPKHVTFALDVLKPEDMALGGKGLSEEKVCEEKSHPTAIIEADILPAEISSPRETVTVKEAVSEDSSPADGNTCISVSEHSTPTITVNTEISVPEDSSPTDVSTEQSLVEHSNPTVIVNTEKCVPEDLSVADANREKSEGSRSVVSVSAKEKPANTVSAEECCSADVSAATTVFPGESSFAKVGPLPDNAEYPVSANNSQVQTLPSEMASDISAGSCVNVEESTSTDMNNLIAETSVDCQVKPDIIVTAEEAISESTPVSIVFEDERISAVVSSADVVIEEESTSIDTHLIHSEVSEDVTASGDVNAANFTVTEESTSTGVHLANSKVREEITQDASPTDSVASVISTSADTTSIDSVTAEGSTAADMNLSDYVVTEQTDVNLGNSAVAEKFTPSDVRLTDSVAAEISTSANVIPTDTVSAGIPISANVIPTDTVSAGIPISANVIPTDDVSAEISVSVIPTDCVAAEISTSADVISTDPVATELTTSANVIPNDTVVATNSIPAEKCTSDNVSLTVEEDCAPMIPAVAVSEEECSSTDGTVSSLRPVTTTVPDERTAGNVQPADSVLAGDVMTVKEESDPVNTMITEVTATETVFLEESTSAEVSSFVTLCAEEPTSGNDATTECKTSSTSALAEVTDDCITDINPKTDKTQDAEVTTHLSTEENSSDILPETKQASCDTSEAKSEISKTETGEKNKEVGIGDKKVLAANEASSVAVNELENGSSARAEDSRRRNEPEPTTSEVEPPVDRSELLAAASESAGANFSTFPRDGAGVCSASDSGESELSGVSATHAGLTVASDLPAGEVEDVDVAVSGVSDNKRSRRKRNKQTNENKNKKGNKGKVGVSLGDILGGGKKKQADNQSAKESATKKSSKKQKSVVTACQEEVQESKPSVVEVSGDASNGGSEAAAEAERPQKNKRKRFGKWGKKRDKEREKDKEKEERERETPAPVPVPVPVPVEVDEQESSEVFGEERDSGSDVSGEEESDVLEQRTRAPYTSLVMITQDAVPAPAPGYTLKPGVVSVVTSETTTLVSGEDDVIVRHTNWEEEEGPGGLAGYFTLTLESAGRPGSAGRRPLVTKHRLEEEQDVVVVTGGGTLSAVVCLEEGLADDDSWVEDVDAEEFATTTPTEDSSSGDEAPVTAYGDREEELRGYHRSAIDFTLHTIVEESCEESDAEADRRRRSRPTSASELEKYFFFGLGGGGGGGGGGGNVEVDSTSECSSIYSEGLESLGAEDGEEMEASAAAEELASSRLEKYFLTGFMGFAGDARDSDGSGSVGSDSEGRPSPEQRRKRLVRARGTGRQHSNSNSLDNLVAAGESEVASPSLGGDQPESSSTETDDPASTAASGFEKADGAFDTVKRKKTKKRSGTASTPEVPDTAEEEAASLSDPEERGVATPQPELPAELCPPRAKHQSRDSGFVGSCDDLLKDSTPVVAEPPPSVAEVKTPPPPPPAVSLTRKDSFNNWSSDEETNLMMSKMRAFFKTMVAAAGSGPTPASPSMRPKTPAQKPPQLVYFENELTRLMKTVPGIRDEQVREIVEYLSSEDTWSDSYDSSDYTSSDLEGGGSQRSQLQQQISQSCQQIISNFDPEEAENTGPGQDTALVYQRLVASFSKMAAGEGADCVGSPHSSPPLLAKVMHHIGSRLVALMHEVSSPRARPRRPSAASTTTEEEDEEIALPRSQSHDLLLARPGLRSSSSGVSDQDERFSWRGSFESALLAADSRTRLSAAKRRSAGDLASSKSCSRDQLDRVRSCGSIAADELWGRRRLSVPEADHSGASNDGDDDDDDDEEEEEEGLRSVTLPRSLQTSCAAGTNSLPRLPTSTASAAMHKAHSTHHVKSARYRPPGFSSRPTAPKRAVSAPGLQPRRDPQRRRIQPSNASPDESSISEEIPTTTAGGTTPGTPEWTAPEEDIDRLVAIHQHRTSLSSLGARSDSLASVYSGAGEGRYGTVAVKGEVEFSLTYNYKASALEITVKQCRDLAPVDAKRNRSDPYVKVYLLPDKSKSGKRKTKVKKHTLNPVFDETLKFSMSLDGLETRTLWLTVWHSDMFGRNDFLGEVMMSLENKVFDDPSPRWYPLCERTEPFEDLAIYKGDIIIGLKFVPPDVTVVKKGKRSRGSLHVLVKEAKNLTAVKASGLSDPFCKCYLLPDKGRSSKQKTPVVRRNCNPSWNYTFVYEDVSLQDLSERCLELTVWDHDRLASNEFLGGLRFSLGTGKHFGKLVDWMDATGKELTLWQSMLERPNFWVEGSISLRPSLDHPNTPS